MKLDLAPRARLLAFALGSAFVLLLSSAPALAESGGDRERRDLRDGEDTVLGEPSDHEQPDPAGSTGRGYDTPYLDAAEGRPTPALRQGADVPIPGAGAEAEHEPPTPSDVR